jgi:hypothetical protein
MAYLRTSSIRSTHEELESTHTNTLRDHVDAVLRGLACQGMSCAPTQGLRTTDDAAGSTIAFVKRKPTLWVFLIHSKITSPTSTAQTLHENRSHFTMDEWAELDCGAFVRLNGDDQK